MNLSHHRRLAATIMLGVIATTGIASAAQAGGQYRRWKPIAGYQRSAVPVSRTYHSSSGGAAPLIAGLIGGIVIGSALSSSAHGSVGYGYGGGGSYGGGYGGGYYYDPYCEVSYNSLDACRSHFNSCDHPQIIQVCERGRPARNLCWYGSNWRQYNGDWRVGVSYRSGGRSYGGGSYGGGHWNNFRDGGQYRHDGGQWNGGRDRNNDGRDGRWNGGERRYKGNDGWNRGGDRGDNRWNDRRGDDRRGDRGDDGNWNRERRSQDDIWDEDGDGVPNSRDMQDRDPRYR